MYMLKVKNKITKTNSTKIYRLLMLRLLKNDKVIISKKKDKISNNGERQYNKPFKLYESILSSDNLFLAFL